MKPLLIINQTSPFGSQSAQESLDLAMASANFGQQVKLLFIDDGVFQLQAGQRPADIALKDFTKSFGALTFYDVDDIYVCQESLNKRNVDIQDLSIDAQALDFDKVQALLASDAFCLRF